MGYGTRYGGRPARRGALPRRSGATRSGAGVPTVASRAVQLRSAGSGGKAPCSCIACVFGSRIGSTQISQDRQLVWTRIIWSPRPVQAARHAGAMLRPDRRAWHGRRPRAPRLAAGGGGETKPRNAHHVAVLKTGEAVYQRIRGAQPLFELSETIWRQNIVRPDLRYFFSHLQ